MLCTQKFLTFNVQSRTQVAINVYFWKQLARCDVALIPRGVLVF